MPTEENVSPEDRPQSPAPASVGRDSPDEVRRQVLVLQSTPLLREMLDAVPTIVLVLNGRHQIVAGNAALVERLNGNTEQMLGVRPGELFHCVHAREGPDGCGTGERCAFCGAVGAVLECQKRGGQTSGEARLLCDSPRGSGAMDVRITATRLDLKDEKFVVAVFEDISQQKRLGVLARLFFHDVMNTVAAMKGYLRLMARRLAENRFRPDDLARLEEMASYLADELQAQRDLTLAEAGDLEPEPQQVGTVELMERLRALFSASQTPAGPRIELAQLWDGRLTTDGRLLGRVLGNMLRNALEATEPGGVVSLRCEERGQRVVFSVHNDAVMPPEVQAEIFHRSFSTKAPSGRGIGTHSIKLLGERYLHGKVGFTSQPCQGTTFWIELPKQWPGKDQGR